MEFTARDENDVDNEENVEEINSNVEIDDYKDVPESTTRSLKRVQYLAKEAQELKEENERLRLDLQQREQALAAYHSALKESEEAKLNAYETSLLQKEERILDELKKAKEEGDVDREVYLTRDLTKLKVDQNAIEDTGQTQDNFNYGQQQRYNAYDEDEIQRYPIEELPEQSFNEEQSEELLRFYHNLPQADPESALFDPQFRNLADTGAEALIKIYKRDGREQEIGSDAFFKTLHFALSKRTQSSSTNSGVNRAGTSMADIYAEKNPGVAAVLTPQQLRIARSLPGNMPEEKKVELYIKALKEESKYKDSLYG